MKTPFIWLGSGRAKKWGVAEKGQRLDAAAKAGLPVPAGAILLDELFQLLWDEGVVEEENGRITATSPEWLYETLYQSVRFPHLDKPAAIRAANAATAMPQLAVDISHPVYLSNSLCELWSRLDGQRRDVLVMEMVDGDWRGTAVTTSAYHHDTITIPDEPPISLPQLKRWQCPDSSLAPHLQRLQLLLRGVRRTFGQGDWHIDWLNDGRICWLLQIQAV